MSEQSVDLKTFMQTNPEGTLEQIAQQYQATMTEVIAAIPDAIITDGSQFETVWQEVTTWGDITFLVHTADIIAAQTRFGWPYPCGKLLAYRFCGT